MPAHHGAYKTKTVRQRHVIEDVQYTHNQDSALAPLECTCGWKGIGRDYPAHRKTEAELDAATKL